MQKVLFTGKILPVGLVNFNIEYSFDLTGDDLRTPIDVEIKDSKVLVSVQIEEYAEKLNGELYRRAYITAKPAVDLVAFSSGKGLLLDLDRLVQPCGKTGPIHFEWLQAASLCKSYSFADISKPLLIAQNDLDVSMGLSDLTETITSPNRVLINSARAMETVRNVIDPNPDRNAAWASMQGALNCSKEYLQSVTTPSQTHRHGNYVSTTNQEGNQILERSWTIMNRFFEYRMRGSKPLSAPEFPLLAG